MCLIKELKVDMSSIWLRLDLRKSWMSYWLWIHAALRVFEQTAKYIMYYAISIKLDIIALYYLNFVMFILIVKRTYSQHW